jgi:hypothetical protein
MSLSDDDDDDDTLNQSGLEMLHKHNMGKTPLINLNASPRQGT